MKLTEVMGLQMNEPKPEINNNPAVDRFTASVVELKSFAISTSTLRREVEENVAPRQHQLKTKTIRHLRQKGIGLSIPDLTVWDLSNVLRSVVSSTLLPWGVVSEVDDMDDLGLPSSDNCFEDLVSSMVNEGRNRRLRIIMLYRDENNRSRGKKIIVEQKLLLPEFLLRLYTHPNLCLTEILLTPVQICSRCSILKSGPRRVVWYAESLLRFCMVAWRIYHGERERCRRIL